MTDAEKDAIRQRVEKATKGPWRKATREEAAWWYGPVFTEDCVIVSKPEEMAVAATNDDGILTDQEIANAEFIAHARQDVPALLAALEASEQRVKALEAQLRERVPAGSYCGFWSLS